MKQKGIAVCCLFLLLALSLTACQSSNDVRDEETPDVHYEETSDVSYEESSSLMDDELTSTEDETLTTTEPTASAPEPEYSEGLSYRLAEGSYYIVVGMGNCTDVNVIIPATHNGKEVRYIESLEGAENVKTLVIPDTVIGYVSGALKWCTNLEELTLPILCPPTYSLFALFNESYADSYTPQKLKKVTLTKETKIGERSFACFASIESIILPNTITAIEDEAFSGCSSLKTLAIPQGVTSIGRDIVNRCTSLKSILLPSSLQKIDANMLFRFGCSNNIVVCYEGTVNQWSQLIERYRWFTPEITIICSDGEWQYTEES